MVQRKFSLRCRECRRQPRRGGPSFGKVVIFDRPLSLRGRSGCGWQCVCLRVGGHNRCSGPTRTGHCLYRPARRAAALGESRNPSGSRLFLVALAGTDRVAVVDTHAKKSCAISKTKPPAPLHRKFTQCAQPFADGSKLFVAEADNNAVAVFNTAEGAAQAGLRPAGRIPTDWYPTLMFWK